MNKRNVAAIENLLRDCPLMVEIVRASPLLDSEARDVPIIARFLADRGVLVPSALTDGDCANLRYWEKWDDPDRDARRIGAELERIAKGEA
jgi:hypothetical protein